MTLATVLSAVAVAAELQPNARHNVILGHGLKVTGGGNAYCLVTSIGGGLLSGEKFKE